MVDHMKFYIYCFEKVCGSDLAFEALLMSIGLGGFAWIFTRNWWLPASIAILLAVLVLSWTVQLARSSKVRAGYER